MSITPYEQPMTTVTHAPAPDYQTVAVQRLGEWATSADAAYKVSERLVQTSFVPSQFKGKAVEATAAILAGAEIGLSPMASLRSFDIIQGTAAPRAITLRAVVQSYGHEIVLVESTATRCRMKGKRRGSDEWQTVTWTIDRAKDLALTSKDNWRKQPAAMLVARATGEIARLIAADAILGIGYSAEEVADGAAGDVPLNVEPDTQADGTPTGTRRMSRRPRPEPAEEPPAAELADDAGPSEAQTKKMFALFNDVGMPDGRTSEGRQARLDYTSDVVGRTVESSKGLTSDEISQVIDALTRDANYEPDAQVDTLPVQEDDQ